jgi:hypothetical protein
MKSVVLNHNVRKGLFVGIDYVASTHGRLYGCANDCHNMLKLFNEELLYTFEECRILSDDPSKFTGNYIPEGKPTLDNLRSGLEWLVTDVHEGDTLIFQYAGHGSYEHADEDSEETDHMNETLCPCDYESNGMMTDNEVSEYLQRLPEGVTLFIFTDCCHSGTNCDLPYQLTIYKKSFESRKKLPRWDNNMEQGRVEYNNQVPVHVHYQATSYADSFVERIMRKEKHRSKKHSMQTFPYFYYDLMYNYYIQMYWNYMNWAHWNRPQQQKQEQLSLNDVAYEFRQTREDKIKATVVSVSGCRDDQVSLEIEGTGALTGAFIQMVKTHRTMSLCELIKRLHETMRQQNLEQRPQVCASFPANVSDTINF